MKRASGTVAFGPVFYQRLPVGVEKAVQSEFELRRHRLCRKIAVERLPGL